MRCKLSGMLQRGETYESFDGIRVEKSKIVVPLCLVNIAARAKYYMPS